MKMNRYFFATMALAACMSSCDLDKLPAGVLITEDQKDEVIAVTPELLKGDINGLAANRIAWNTLGLAKAQHFDFGFASVCMMTDASGQDVVADNSGYNWFAGNLTYSDRNYTSYQVEFIWKVFYNHLLTANNIIGMVDPATYDDELRIFRGQALASRAFDYLNLVQMFQFTYAGHEQAPAVPIVKEGMTGEQIANNPRAKVQEVYDLIISDLTEAISLLEGYNHGMDRSGKGLIDQQVAYGLRARANLLMQKWSEAAADADKAMAGYSPVSKAEASKPGFHTAASTAWIWADVISEDNQIIQTGILNWPSHMCTFTGNGYTTGTGTYRIINNKLWAQIPDSDVRKGWWLNDKGSSPLSDGIMMGKDKFTDAVGCPPYANVKFAAYKGEVMNATNASDWPLMRVEEMILIKAEALAQQGQTGAAAQALKPLMAERDSEWNKAEVTVDDVWFQRRIELWGEGFSFLDILRLKKPVERIGTNYDQATLGYNLPAESKIFLWRIPECEISSNSGISNADNNEAVPAPKPEK